jgi:flagellar biosynthesis regulator FlaF
MYNVAATAYGATAALRPARNQEADVFRQSARSLAAARKGRSIEQIRALADNRRMWMSVIDLMRDPSNALPTELRASIISLGLAVQRESESEVPDFEFLISVNHNMAAGLDGQPWRRITPDRTGWHDNARQQYLIPLRRYRSIVIREQRG